LNESTIYKYRLLLNQIGNFAKERGLRYLKELNLPMRDDFRSEWKGGPRSALKKLERLRAFVLLLRYSGLRIGDAVGLSTDRVQDNRLFLYTQKTGVPAYCVLPDFVVKTLESSPRPSEQYFFWTGRSKAHSAKGKWQRRLQRLFELAEIPKGHAHRFRDTFAVELCFRAYHWSESRFCLAIPACALLNATTRHGYGRGRSSLKRICKVRGAKTRLR